MAEPPKKIDSVLTWSPGFCKHCQTCVHICPVHNLEFQDDEMASQGKCIQCELCQEYCPDFAIEVEPKRAKAKKEKE